MVQLHEDREFTRLLLDATPLAAQFWDKDLNVIACNQETVRLFGAPSKQDYLENFYGHFPQYQPDGKPSKATALEILKKALEEGHLCLEWMCQTMDGTPIPTEVTLVRVDYQGSPYVATYTRDLREQKRMMREIDVAVAKLQSANQALESAQNTMSIRFAANPHVNIMFNSDFEVIDCNPAAVQFLGFKTKEEMIAGFAERIAQSIPPVQSEGRTSVSITDRLAVAAKEGFAKFETDLVLGGKVRNLNVEFKRIPYEESFAIVAYVFDFTDIHERERELAHAREQNELQLAKLNLVIQATKIGLWELEIVDDDLTNPAMAFTWSDEFRKMLGFTDETDFPNVHGSWSDRLHPDDKEETLAHAVRHIQDKTGNTPYDREYRLLKKNGEYGYFRAYGGTSRDENGNALRIAGSLMDITEAKNTLLNNEIQLAKLGLVVQATKIGLWEMEIANSDPISPVRSIMYSDEFRNLLGITDEPDFPNVLGSWIDRLHPEEKEEILNHLEQYVQNKTGSTIYDKEYRLLKKNGEYGHFRAYGGSFRDEHGNVTRIAGALMDITETKQALINNEFQLTKMNLMVQATKIGLWEMVDINDDVFNLENVFLWSDEFRHLLGFTDETDFPNVCRSWWERLHPEDTHRTYEAFNQHLFDRTGKTPFDIEYRLLRKEGEYGYYRASGATIRDEEGNPIRVAGALMDITKTKKMTEALNEAVEESQKTIEVMANVLNNSDGMIYVTDKDTDEILFINDSLKRHMGIEGEVIGQLCYKVFNVGVESRCEWCPCHQLDKEPDKAVVWEENNTLTKRHYRNTDRYIEWHDGRLVHIQHTVDLTDIKQMSERLEAALEQTSIARDELTLQKATLQTVIDSIPDIVFCKDKDFKYTLINTACRNYINAKADEMVGRDDYELGFPVEVSDRLRAIDKQVFSGMQRVVDTTWIPSFEGETRYLETIKAPLSQNGTIVGVVGISRDTTEKMRMEKALEAALTQAEAASRAKTDFLSKMSHEIRTPMNAILGITEIQMQNDALPVKTKEALDKIHGAGELLLNIINDILDLSKIEAGKLELVPVKYDVASLINDVVTLNIMRIGSKSIEFKLTLDENIPTTLFGDELRIKQILNNLLSNAFKYTPEGCVELSIYMDTDKDADSALVFAVKDTGLGMSEEQISRLFDEYTRFNLKANRAMEGTGLGMNIAQNLVKMMGGTIAVESELGKGSTFTVRLPQEDADAEVLGRELADNLENFRTDGVKQLKMAQVLYEPMPYGNVLIVDDVESNIYVATGLLAPYGLSIETAESGYETIEKIKEGKEYDIIFMDHMMPGMDGLEAAQILRKMGYTHPIVALTANALAGQAEMFLENGFDGFVSKPIDLRHLNAILKKFVRDKQDSGILRAAEQQQKEQEQAHAEKQTAQPLVKLQLIEFFLQDAHKALAALQELHERCHEHGLHTYSAEDIRSYVVSVHAMKSALGYMEESELVALAGKLEVAGRTQDTAVMSAETPAFLEQLRAVIEKLTRLQQEEAGESPAGDHSLLREKLLTIKEACGNFDKKTAKSVLAELRKQTWQSPIGGQLDMMSKLLLDGDFEEVASTVEGMVAE